MMQKETLLGAGLHGDKKKPASHRYNPLPLLPSGPGGVQGELVVPAVQK